MLKSKWAFPVILSSVKIAIGLSHVEKMTPLRENRDLIDEKPKNTHE